MVPDSFRRLHVHARILNPKTKVNTLYPITVEFLKQIGGKLRGNITATAAKLWLDLRSYKNCCIFNVSVAVAVVVAEVP